MRKYPPVTFLDRKCNADYKISGTNIIVEKGTSIYVPVWAIQNDPIYFPSPQEYIPERYKENINDSKLVYMPFGYGPRSCIGELFFFNPIGINLLLLLTIRPRGPR